jgi:hypothetical protein
MKHNAFIRRIMQSRNAQIPAANRPGDKILYRGD